MFAKQLIGQRQVEHDNRSQPCWSTAFRRRVNWICNLDLQLGFATWICQTRLKPELQRKTNAFPLHSTLFDALGLTRLGLYTGLVNYSK
jgi:hypothetical protein